MRTIPQQLYASLKSGGLKATPGRLVVLDVLKKTQRPLSAKAVAEQVSKRSDINASTVYRILEHLEKTDIVRRVDLQHGHAHFELNTRDDHHHLVCLKCGRIEDFSHLNFSAAERAILKKSKHFKNITKHTLEFFGYCNKCAKQQV